MDTVRLSSRNPGMHVSFVSVLALFVGPDAIGRRIGAIIVNSLQSLPRRPRPHVAEEFARIGNPFLRHNYSPTAVVWIAWAVRICAAILCRVIGLKLRGNTTVSSRAMSGGYLGYPFSPEAAAGRGEPLNKLIAIHSGNGSAVALTYPHCATTYSLGPNSNEAIEPLTNDICEERHILRNRGGGSA